MLDLSGTANPELPGSQKGRNPFVFTRKRKKQLLPDGSTRRFFAQLRRIPIAVGGFAALRIWEAELGSENGPAGRSLPV